MVWVLTRSMCDDTQLNDGGAERGQKDQRHLKTPTKRLIQIFKEYLTKQSRQVKVNTKLDMTSTR